jgi:rod shape determining protein RodA
MYSVWWKRVDWYMVGAILGLVGVGLLMLLSTTIGTDQPYARNQLMFAGLGVGLFIAISRLDAKWVLRMSPLAYGAVVLLLVAVAIFAQVTRGAAAWLQLGPFSLQPSEFAKPVLILFLAYLFQSIESKRGSWVRLLLGYGAALVPLAVLILLQPDLGTLLVITSGWLAVVWFSPFSRWVYGGLLAAVVSGIAAAWLFLAEYQKLRILTFLSPTADPLGSGYNVLQSIIAVGSGMLLGQGWGHGTQSHLNFLPEHHTDFIFASLSEEFGFVGSVGVLLLYGVILWRGARLMWRAKDRQTLIAVSGILVMFLFQAGVNIAMNVGMAPVTGIPLPLVSYGGSSLLVTFISLGIVHRIAIEQAVDNEEGKY